MEFFQLILRALQLLWTLLITALIGNVIADAFSGNASSINYAMFVAVFSWIVVLFGFGAAFMDALNIPLVLVVLDSLAALFTFIAGVVLAAKLGVHSCTNFNYTATNHLTNGGPDLKERCQELQASTAFFWFLWVCYMGSVAIAFMNRSSGTSSVGSSRRGPVMTQV
jgi:hypothetical protein